MNSRSLPAILFLIASGMFLSMGLRRGAGTYVALGIAFLVLGITAARKAGGRADGGGPTTR